MNLDQSENQIDHIIDCLSDDVTWFLCSRTILDLSVIHFARCMFVELIGKYPSYKITFACSDKTGIEIHDVINPLQADRLKRFINSVHNLQVMHIQCTTQNDYITNELTLLNYLVMYEKSNWWAEYSLSDIHEYTTCPHCYEWFKDNTFRIPELAICNDKSVKSGLIFSNGKPFGNYKHKLHAER